MSPSLKRLKGPLCARVQDGGAGCHGATQGGAEHGKINHRVFCLPRPAIQLPSQLSARHTDVMPVNTSTNHLAFIYQFISYHVSCVFGSPYPVFSHFLILFITVSLFMGFFSTASLANGEALLYFCTYTEVTPSDLLISFYKG